MEAFPIFPGISGISPTGTERIFTPNYDKIHENISVFLQYGIDFPSKKGYTIVY